MLELMSNDERELCVNNKLDTKPCPLPSLPVLPRLLLLMLLMGLKNVKIESIFIGDDKWLIYD